MGNFKKVISLILALALVLSSATVAVAAAPNATQEKAEVLNELGLLAGISTTKFDADITGTTNREQAMKTIAMALGWAVDDDAVSTFPDVSVWAQKYVAVAVAKGITNGVGEGLFGGFDPVNARQLKTWIGRALGNPIEGSWTGNAGYDQTKDLSRGDLVDAIFATLSEVPSGETLSLAGSLFADNAAKLALATDVGIAVEPVIIHSVAFTLDHETGSVEETKFLEESFKRLSVIPGVMDFQVLKQTSVKNPYAFELEMKFASQADYDAYNIHPNHYNQDGSETGYVPELFIPEVTSFLEKDTVVLKNEASTPIEDGYIHHTVVFNLKHAAGSAEEEMFLQQSMDSLSTIPGCLNFTVSKQTSPKNPYSFELTMDFATQADYDAYNIHPNHYNQDGSETGYVPEYFIPEVTEFLEKDTVVVMSGNITAEIPADPVVIHSVAVKLMHDAGTVEEAEFLQESWDRLSTIPGVMDFQVLKQTSPKNPYDFELEMKFANKADYDAYNVHPNHYNQDGSETGYVPEIFLKEVTDFLEKDTVVLKSMAPTPIKEGYIHHTVVFNLSHAAGSAAEEQFLQQSWDSLSVIPGVLNFTVSKQTSPKNPYSFELTMDFAKQADYDAYNVHPNHYNQDGSETGYVPEYFLKEVTDFLEKDTVIMNSNDISAQVESPVIIHSVAMKLAHEADSAEEALFLQESFDRLSVIPGVIDFQVLNQTSPKNPYDFELEMKFAGQSDYDAYNVHPNHYNQDGSETGYVPEIFLVEVTDFLEKDTVVLKAMAPSLVKDGYIHHTVAFNLSHPAGSELEDQFLQQSWDSLSVIPGVLNFTVSQQISPKNPYSFELTMDFATQADYDAYNVHPNHYNQDGSETGYVPEYFLKEVTEFLEKDTMVLISN